MLQFRADQAIETLPSIKEVKEVGMPVIFSLRSKAEGGQSIHSLQERHQLLRKAAARFDWVELEGERDLDPALLADVPAEKRLISWHGPSCTLTELMERLSAFSTVPAHRYLLVPHAKRHGDELPILELLRQSTHKNLIAFAAGSIGRWTRVVSPMLGSPLAFAATEGSIDGAPTPAQWETDFVFPRTTKPNTIFGIAGNPVAWSLSPRLHNQAYHQLNLPFLYLPFHVESYSDFWSLITNGCLERATGMQVKGFTTVSPFKEAAYKAINYTENPYVALTGAGNLALKQSGVWKSNSTDGLGVQSILEQLGFAVKDRNIAVLGCGGAGRVIAARLAAEGGTVQLYNRSAGRGKVASEMLDIPWALLSDFHPSRYDLIINATTQGKEEHELPADPEQAAPKAIFIDLIYTRNFTPMIRKAQRIGLRNASGLEILIHQVRAQFLAMTGHEMPIELARQFSGLNSTEPLLALNTNYDNTRVHENG